MNCTECDGKVRRLDKRIGGLACFALALLMGLRLDPELSFRFAGSMFFWLILFIVPGMLLLLSKPRYNFWCSSCKKMVSPRPARR